MHLADLFVLITPGVLMATMFFTGFGIVGIFAGMGPFTAEMVANTTSRGLAMGIATTAGAWAD